MFEGIPTEELLESTHTFPCQYRFKVIGATDDHFVGRVLAVAREQLAVDAEPAFSTRTTSGGRHVSVTLDLEVETAADVVSVYVQLRRLEGLVMLM